MLGMCLLFLRTTSVIGVGVRSIMGIDIHRSAIRHAITIIVTNVVITADVFMTVCAVCLRFNRWYIYFIMFVCLNMYVFSIVFIHALVRT